MKRVFADSLNRLIDCYVEEHSKIKLMEGESLESYLKFNNSVFTSELISLLDNHASLSAATGRAHSLNLDFSNEEKLNQLKYKFGYLSSEEFLFNNKIDTNEIINKNDYLIRMVDSVVFSNDSLENKKERIRNEIQIMKFSISNHIIGIMSRSPKKGSNIKDYILNYGEPKELNVFRKKEKA